MFISFRQCTDQIQSWDAVDAHQQHANFVLRPILEFLCHALFSRHNCVNVFVDYTWMLPAEYAFKSSACNQNKLIFGLEIVTWWECFTFWEFHLLISGFISAGASYSLITALKSANNYLTNKDMRKTFHLHCVLPPVEEVPFAVIMQYQLRLSIFIHFNGCQWLFIRAYFEFLAVKNLHNRFVERVHVGDFTIRSVDKKIAVHWKTQKVLKISQHWP